MCIVKQLWVEGYTGERIARAFGVHIDVVLRHCRGSDRSNRHNAVGHLSSQEVRDMREWHEMGMSCADIGRHMGRCRKVVWAAVNYRTYKWVD